MTIRQEQKQKLQLQVSEHNTLVCLVNTTPPKEGKRKKTKKKEELATWEPLCASITPAEVWPTAQSRMQRAPSLPRPRDPQSFAIQTLQHRELLVPRAPWCKI